MLLILGPHFENQWFRPIRDHLRGLDSMPRKCTTTQRREDTETKSGSYEKMAREENCWVCYRVAKEQPGRD